MPGHGGGHFARRRARSPGTTAVNNRAGGARVIVSDNGTELTSGAVLRWATGRLDWHYIEPGKPGAERLCGIVQQPPAGRMPQPAPVPHPGGSAGKPSIVVRHDYNHSRPHGSLGALTPAAFAALKGQHKLPPPKGENKPRPLLMNGGNLGSTPPGLHARPRRR